jgi:hypothetical protein
MLKHSIIVATSLLATPAFADVCAWNAKPVADAAVKMLSKGTAIQEFCAPCKDTKAKRIVVDTTAIEQRDPASQSSYEIKVNGKGIDLAYTYTLATDRKAWKNLGFAVKCDAQKDDAPAELKPDQVAN